MPVMSWRGSAAVALTSVALGMASVSAVAQSRPSIETLDSRLARVERVLDQSLLDQLQRIDSLQIELRELRGELERLNNEIETLKRRNGDLYADTDRRVTDLEESRDSGGLFGGVFSGDGALAGGGGLDLTGTPPSAPPNATDATQPASPGRFVANRPNAAGSGDLQPVQVRTNATQAEKAAYTRAYDLLARGQNAAAVAEFDAFIEEYPDGPYSFNAWYWKGEAMYAERDFDKAIANFTVVTDRFPSSTKVPDAQLKIGFSLYEQGDFAAARGILERVRDEFQGRSAAVLARKRLQKMDREGV